MTDIDRLMEELKFGKREAQPSPKDFQLFQVQTSPLPTPPYRFGNGMLYGPNGWMMLGNSKAGNCVFAGGDHEEMTYTKLLHGTPAKFSDDTALADYGAVTGYDPATGANDNGTYVKDAMEYRRTTGLVDVDGNRHKIDAYVSIDAKDWDTMIRAVYVFGAVGIGFEVPDTIWNMFDSGDVWDASPGAQIIGGHYIPIVGSMDWRKRATAVSWGRRIELTREFYEAYNDEAWVPLSLELVHAGYGLHHISEATLRSMLSSLGS